MKQQPHMAAIKGNGRENIPVQDCVWRKLKWCRIPVQVPFLFLSSPSNWAARHGWLGELSWCPERSIPFPEYPVLPTHTKGLLPRLCFPSLPSWGWSTKCLVVLKSLGFLLKRQCQENFTSIFSSYWAEREWGAPVPNPDHSAQICQ